MCWSAQVSLRFACLDTFFVALLLAKALLDKSSKRRILRLTYAAMMSCVAVQEWSQYGIWKRGRLAESSYNCADAPDVLLSIMTTGAAESVPLPLIVSSFWTRRTDSPTAIHHNAMRHTAVLLWFMQFSIVLLSTIATQKYCVELGKNSHQVWICESAPYEAGGQFLHQAFFWIYCASSLCAAESLDMPSADRRRLQMIGLFSAVVSIALYGKTLEACSVWCWSAFVLGICLCLQEYGYIGTISTIISNDTLAHLFLAADIEVPQVKVLSSETKKVIG